MKPTKAINNGTSGTAVEVVPSAEDGIFVIPHNLGNFAVSSVEASGTEVDEAELPSLEFMRELEAEDLAGFMKPTKRLGEYSVAEGVTLTFKFGEAWFHAHGPTVLREFEPANYASFVPAGSQPTPSKD